MWFFFFVYAEMSFLLFALQAISKTNTCYVLLSHIFCTHNLPSLFFFFFLPNSTFFSRPSWSASLAAISKSVVEDELLTSFSFGIFGGHWWHFRTLVFPSVFLAGNGNVFFFDTASWSCSRKRQKYKSALRFVRVLRGFLLLLLLPLLQLRWYKVRTQFIRT